MKESLTWPPTTWSRRPPRVTGSRLFPPPCQETSALALATCSASNVADAGWCRLQQSQKKHKIKASVKTKKYTYMNIRNMFDEKLKVLQYGLIIGRTNP
jgi:hypothetical protein